VPLPELVKFGDCGVGGGDWRLRLAATLSAAHLSSNSFVWKIGDGSGPAVSAVAFRLASSGRSMFAG
jgi:hypothetical protein